MDFFSDTKEVQKLKLFENRELRRTVGPKKV
jgi:hypothetical protein